MKTKRVILSSLVLAAITLTALPLQAAIFTFQTLLSGLNENPPNGSPGSGFGQVVLNDVLGMITVNESWSGLTAPATASHIHGAAPPGMNAPVLFPFSGVPAATAGAIPTQTFAITSAQISDLEAGLYYMNVHTANFPGGEIRGQLIQVPGVPDSGPGLAGLATLLAPCVLAGLRRRMVNRPGI